VGNRFVEYIGSVWREIRLCVKILIAVVVISVFLQAAEIVSLYINVNSGGLESTSRAIFLFCFYGLLPFFLIFIILVPLCFIVALINIDEPINIFLTVVAVVIAVASFEGRFYIRDDKLKFKPEPDSTRCVVHNMARGKGLKELGLKLDLLKNAKDFVFTEQFLEPNSTYHIYALTKGTFVLNSNLLDKKPSQLSNDVVAIFESNISPRDNIYIGGPNDISTWWHYGRGSLMVFGDGRVEFIKTEDFNNLRWKP
jgi:hypothetical protein